MLSLNGEEISEPIDPITIDFEEQLPEGDVSESQDSNLNANMQNSGLRSSSHASNNMDRESLGQSRPISLSPIVNINLNKKSSIDSIPRTNSNSYEGTEQSSFMNNYSHSDRPIWVVYEDSAVENGVSLDSSTNVTKEKNEDSTENKDEQSVKDELEEGIENGKNVEEEVNAENVEEEENAENAENAENVKKRMRSM